MSLAVSVFFFFLSLFVNIVVLIDLGDANNKKIPCYLLSQGALISKEVVNTHIQSQFALSFRKFSKKVQS